MKIDPKDIRFEVFSGFGPGGANRNKCQKCVRAIHTPTGVKATATKERSLRQNKKAAIEALQEKLDQLVENQKEKQSKIDRNLKPEASFGSQIRTYKMVGSNQGVTDHRTGITASIHEVLEKGNIEALK